MNLLNSEILRDYERLQKHNCSKKNSPLEISWSRDGLKMCEYFFGDLLINTAKPKKRHYLKDGTLVLHSYDTVKNILEEEHDKLEKYQLKYNLPRLIDAFTMIYGRVFMYKPVVVKFFIDKYKPKTMLDCYAGWGNRLLSCLATNINYIGIDTNKKLCEKLNLMSDLLKDKSDVLIINKPAESIDYYEYVYDMVFMCPPYSLIEIYEDMPLYMDDVDFINKSFLPTIKNVWNNLSNNGLFIITCPRSWISLLPFKNELVEDYVYPKNKFKSRTINKEKSFEYQDTETIYVFIKHNNI